ncbi:hypothetical protein Y032_0148g2676 [Ancylostoma ceylanicum]|uniref:SCP domain-containing protein n=1 Tax=Ancylostoma ceylanicum TaxID=53326 RepID=A0A016T151_9BILA|nr:hypothetical protein Y032_0148g2676 [Ancylostoma ceylanicum]
MEFVSTKQFGTNFSGRVHFDPSPKTTTEVYTCGLENRAYEFVRNGGPSIQIGGNVLYEERTGRHNLREVVSRWSERLKSMAKKKFGCNLSIDASGYKVACVFK